LLGSVAPFVASEASAASDVASSQPPAAVSLSSVSFNNNAIACPTANTCVAGGVKPASGDGAIVVINGSNGAVGTVVTDSGAEGFEGLGCATASECLAVGFEDVTAVNGANGATGSNKSTDSILDAVACATADICYAGGTNTSSGKFKSTLVEVSSHGAPGAEKDIGSGIDSSIACVSASRCYAAIANSSDSHIDVLDNGAVDKSFAVGPEAPNVIACFRAASCVAVGNDDGTAYVIPLNATTGQPGKAQVIDGMSQVNGVACATATACVAVGSDASSGSRISDIENGKAQPAKAASGQELEGVACSTSTTCWAIGDSSKGAGIVVAVPPA